MRLAYVPPAVVKSESVDAAPEFIIAAALRLEDGEVITAPPPARHHMLVRNWCIEHEELIPYHDCGFLTSRGRFARRRPAAIIAFKAGQTAEPKDRLLSVDLW